MPSGLVILARRHSLRDPSGERIRTSHLKANRRDFDCTSGDADGKQDTRSNDAHGAARDELSPVPRTFAHCSALWVAFASAAKEAECERAQKETGQ